MTTRTYTQEEIDAIQSSAYNRGYSKGHDEGYDDGNAE